jgi:hypothetical protein
MQTKTEASLYELWCGIGCFHVPHNCCYGALANHQAPTPTPRGVCKHTVPPFYTDLGLIFYISKHNIITVIMTFHTGLI